MTEFGQEINSQEYFVLENSSLRFDSGQSLPDKIFCVINSQEGVQGTSGFTRIDF